MNGHVFGHEFVSESVSEADSDTTFFGTSDTDSDMNRVMTSDTDSGSDTHMSENLGHWFGLGHDYDHEENELYRIQAKLSMNSKMVQFDQKAIYSKPSYFE